MNRTKEDESSVRGQNSGKPKVGRDVHLMPSLRRSAESLFLRIMGASRWGPEIAWSDEGTPEDRTIFLRNLASYRRTAERIYQGNHGGGIPVASAMLDGNNWYREVVDNYSKSVDL